jgi:hypothetical protein
MSGTSTEILSIPELARKIRIWTRSLESSTIVVEWAGNQQIFQIMSTDKFNLYLGDLISVLVKSIFLL